MIRIAVLTVLAMIAFAANSVFARLAMGPGDIDPLQFSALRLASGAAILALLLAPRAWRRSRHGFSVQGNWPATLALFSYAVLFSLAYVALGAATGALILFASVQAAMLGWAILNGDRPGHLEWLGLGIAAVAFCLLISPAVIAPDPLGATLMIGSGLCWAAYSLIGQRSSAPLEDTAGNFIRTLPAAVLVGIAGWFVYDTPGAGALYALASGALASGLGYAIWYAALPGLSRTNAAIVQLSVPAIAAIGGVFFIGEKLTPQLLVASIAILGGVALTVYAGGNRRNRKTGMGVTMTASR